MKSSKSGLTLIEVMVSLTVFSVAIALISGFVKTGVERPFAIYEVEEWLRFIEDSGNLVQQMPKGADLSMFRTDNAPLNKVQKPPDLNNWDVHWYDTNFPRIKLAHFSATNKQNRLYQWRIYRESE